jgi:hypothetical protein
MLKVPSTPDPIGLGEAWARESLQLQCLQPGYGPGILWQRISLVEGQ